MSAMYKQSGEKKTFRSPHGKHVVIHNVLIRVKKTRGEEIVCMYVSMEVCSYVYCVYYVANKFRRWEKRKDDDDEDHVYFSWCRRPR